MAGKTTSAKVTIKGRKQAVRAVQVAILKHQETVVRQNSHQRKQRTKETESRNAKIQTKK